MMTINRKEKKALRWTCAIAIAILSVACIYVCHRLMPSRERVRAGMTYIEAYTWYEFQQNGKTLLTFDADTIKLSACFADKWALVPSCQGRLVAANDHRLTENIYKKVSPQTVFQEKIDSVEKTYEDAKWKVAELKYYLQSHDAKDMGYGAIYKYTMRETQVKEQSHKLLDSLKGITVTNGLKLLRHIRYAVCASTAKSKQNGTLLPCSLMDEQPEDGSTRLFQLAQGQLPEGNQALSMRLAAQLAHTHSLAAMSRIDFGLRYDSLGTYRGNTNDGTAVWEGKDGSHYEGEWKDGMRNGFGFSIAPGKTLRVGEWKDDRYRGERLVYTTERIYGIDISKYQHGKGRKKYPIDWKALRITHLGSISRKAVSGSVDFPISFVYIKSTEGATLLNPFYKSDYRAARARGFRVGTYHFFSTLSPVDRQVRLFLKHSIISRGDLPPVLDVEPTEAQIKKMGGKGVLFSRIRTWLRQVERLTGTKPILYVNQPFVTRYLNAAPDLKHNYRIWIARYGEYKPDLRLVYWQLCPDGRVKGIRGQVDINVFNGYKSAYQKFLEDESVR